MSAEERIDPIAMLNEDRAGCPDPKDRLIRAIYKDLLRIARAMMRHERRDHTLQASALVHEAVVRLLDKEALRESSDPSQVLAAAVQAMRQILVDHARRRNAGKRGGGRGRVPLDEVLVSFEEQGVDVIDLHQALERLAQSNPDQARVVELHIFGGLSIGEIATTLVVSRHDRRDPLAVRTRLAARPAWRLGTMTPERGQRVYAVFEAALACDPVGRAALLEALCADDLELRAEVERLLAQDAQADRDHFLATPASMGRDALRSDKSTDGKSQFHWSQVLEGTSAETPRPATTPLPDFADHPNYVIKGELGRGGMGVVYLAQNTLMGRPEVLKVVSNHLINRPGVIDRFLTEIRNAARLHHSNIVTAYAAFRVGESFVLAMEYVEGFDLARIVQTCGPLPVAHACNHVRQAALGLQHAHEHSMVHRDIKPSNLILARQGNRALIKVLDFGLAKVQSEGAVDGGLTHEGQLLGTPAYIAPEQISDARRADIRADIYSLGCTLYYLLTGAPPFQGAQPLRHSPGAPLNGGNPVEPGAAGGAGGASDRGGQDDGQGAEASLPGAEGSCSSSDNVLQERGCISRWIEARVLPVRANGSETGVRRRGFRVNAARSGIGAGTRAQGQHAAAETPVGIESGELDRSSGYRKFRGREGGHKDKGSSTALDVASGCV